MHRFMDVPVRSVAGGVGTYDLAAGEFLPIGTASADLIPVADGSAVVLPNDGWTRPGEARAR